MGHIPFTDPVSLKLNATGTFVARSPREAVEYLDHLWPGDRGAHYRQAKLLCHAAADGTVSPETARIALTDAARRSGLLAKGHEVDGLSTNVTYVTGDVPWRETRRHGAPDELEVTESDLVSYFRASDILEDPSLSPSRKRALLAYWASDLHAVAGAPYLRCVRGVTVTIDSIRDAMCSLDAEIDRAAMPDSAAATGRAW